MASKQISETTLSIFDVFDTPKSTPFDEVPTGPRMPVRAITTPGPKAKKAPHETMTEKDALLAGWLWVDGMQYREPHPLKSVGKCGPDGRCTYYCHTGLEQIDLYIEKLNRIADRKAVYAIDYETSACKKAPVDPITGKFDLDKLSWSTEKTTKYKGSDPHTSIIFLCSISYKRNESHVIDVREALRLRPVEFRAALARAVTEGRLIAHNADFEWRFTKALCGADANVGFDTMILTRILYAGLPDPAIPWTDPKQPPVFRADAESVLMREMGIQLNKKWQTFFLQIHPESAMTDELIAYVAGDTAYHLELTEILVKKLQGKGLYHLWRDIERPFLKVLSRTCYYGVPVDVDLIIKDIAEAEAEVAELLPQWKALNTGIKNYNSGDEVLAYYKQQYPQFDFVNQKGKESVDKEVLDNLYETTGDESVKLLGELREVSKVLSTYLRPWLMSARNAVTGRIHSSFAQCDTATGRMSSKAPNLQNLPSKSKWHKIRAVFICKPKEEDPNNEEHILVDRDLSQFEVRALADMAGETKMIEFFRVAYDIEQKIRDHWALHPEYGIRHEGSLSEFGKKDEILGALLTEKKKNDFHVLNAIALFKEEFTNGDEATQALCRKKGKSCSFGLPYGVTARKLAADFKSTEDEMQVLIDTYYSTWPNIGNFLERCRNSARFEHEIESPSGRKRFFARPKLFDDATKRSIYKAYGRQAQNCPVQGINGDVLKVATVLMAPEVYRCGGEFLLWVHDETLIDCPKKHTQHLANHMEDCLVEAARRCNIMDVPIETSCEISKSWSH